MQEWQKIYTENVYGIGLTQYPGALIINKRFSNIPPGAPIFMYNWAEDNIIRERVWVAADKQGGRELHPRHPARRAGRRRAGRVNDRAAARPPSPRPARPRAPARRSSHPGRGFSDDPIPARPGAPVDPRPDRHEHDHLRDHQRARPATTATTSAAT